jgi:hypothetical protein
VSDASTTVTWVALLVGAVGAAVAGWRLRRRNPAAGGRSRDLAMLLFGLVVVLNTVPRLAGASSGTVLVFSSIALLPLAGFVALCVRGLRA